MSSKVSTPERSASFRLQAELRRDLYQAIFSHSSEPIAIIDPQGFYLEQNEAHSQLLGYSDEDLQSQTPAIYMGEDVFAEIADALREKGDYRGDVVIKTKTGEIRHIELSAFAMRNDSGEPVCYVGIKRDITERKQAQEALQRSEAELTDFFENASLPLHWIGPDGTILRVNQAELDMLGYTREEYVGHHIAEFHVDQNVIQDILARLQAGEVLQNYEARLRCKDGGIKHVLISSSVYREDGNFVHTRCFTRDITERKRSESRLGLQYAITKILSESHDFVKSAQSILQAVCESLDWAVGALWRVDRQTETMRCVDICHATSMATPEFDRLTQSIAFKKGVGLPGRIWELGKPAWINNVPADDNFPRAGVAAREGLHGAFGFPVLLGSEVWGAIEFFSPEIREPDEELLRLVAGIGGQIGQLTKRKRAEEDRAELFKRERAARADAEKANRLKDEFLATLSHELRTPLNAVIGWSRMLGSGRLDRESSKHALEVIERNAWAQKQIIEDILDVSRVITGKLQLNVSPVDLVAVMDAALDAVRPAMEAKEIKIETIIDASLRMISGDANRLQQVIWNILSNAAKFTPNRGRVEISVSQTAAHVQIQVKDSGPGIEPAFLPYVFERFRQADGSITRTHGGLGLGLAIARHLVELHGGTIGVENRDDGQGAVFTIRLPLPSGELRPEALAGADSAVKENQSEQASLEGLAILIVDDETDALDLITVELAQHGAKVTAVTNAEDALKALDQGNFDLLISDISMPKIDGYDLIRQIRKNEAGINQKIPAVALTAYARVQDRMQAIMAGYSTHIAKPVDANELLTVIASLAGRLGKN
ncbi:MAG TPA: hybrid sensor histidine kinase/response regulator [Blastocatellia bacterium]|jgi:PAS domain S-box-containing protein|nr:hybrid sensor histidine kinase/response regulator [Blastocatellia bacterium]HAF24819.1 hybrid sensor histidine kinase/response regulator [Blastocatellia bacterium]HCX29354.1 hybrid sensor histidine kinase/response regulator [Blastocatellia bacterium]